MSTEFFKKKITTKSDKELTNIINKPSSFTLKARLAAGLILEQRGIYSDSISLLKQKSETLKNIDIQKKLESEQKKLEIVNHLKSMNAQESHVFVIFKNPRLEQERCLEIKRIDAKHYEIKLRDEFERKLNPRIICKLTENANLIYYPLINFKTILSWVIISCLTLLIFHYVDYAQIDKLNPILLLFIFLFPALVQLFRVLILLPLSIFEFNKLFNNTVLNYTVEYNY
ncbi:hypothetical protein EP331_13160 [bacterium]|nr:MAG: hypothetical protein EP331_13160 [bacterium]